jgi:hypothetical protein
MHYAQTNRHRWRAIAAVALSATLLLACSSDPASSPLSSIERPEQPVEEPAPEEPASEEPAPEEPAPEEPAPEDVEGAPLTTEEWVLVILLGLLALAAVAGIVALFSRRSKGQSVDTSSKQRLLDDITRTCRSVHDTSVLSLLQATDSVTLLSGWGAAQRQLVDLEGRISSLAVGLTDPANLRSVQELGAAVTGVRGALESNVGLRMEAGASGQADLIEASNRTVLYRSEQLESALQRALYLRL